MDIPIIEEIIKPVLFGKSFNIRTNVADIANSSPQSFISGNELPKIIPTTVKICQFK